MLLPLLNSYCGSIQINFPSYGMTNVSITPTLNLSLTNYRFVTSKLQTNPSLPDYYYDTVGNRFNSSQIFVFSYEDYIRFNQNAGLASDVGFPGYSTIINNSTISVGLKGTLKYNKSYCIYIKDLYTYNPLTGDTLLLDTLVVNAFSTTSPLPQVKFCSLDYSHIIDSTSDIIVYFKSKVGSGTTTPMGSLINVEKVSGKTMITSEKFQNQYSNVGCQYSFNLDSTQITIHNPAGYQKGASYRLTVHSDYLTGDTLDIFKTDFYILKKAEILIKSASLDTNLTLPDSVAPYGGNISWAVEESKFLTLTSPKSIGDWGFLYWSCPDIPLIDHSPSNKITFQMTRNIFKNHTITAVYNKYLVDTVVVKDTMGIHCLVEHYTANLGNGVYTYTRRPHDFIRITGIPDDSIRFVHWTSPDSAVNGSDKQTIQFTHDKAEIMFGDHAYDDNFRKIEISPFGDGPFGGGPPAQKCNDLSYCIELDLPTSIQNGFTALDDYLEVYVDNPDLGFSNQKIANNQWNINWDAEKGKAQLCLNIDATNLPLDVYSLKIKVKINAINSDCLAILNIADAQETFRHGWSTNENYYPLPPSNNLEDCGKIVEVDLPINRNADNCKNTCKVEIGKRMYLLKVYLEMADNAQYLPYGDILDHVVLVDGVAVNPKLSACEDQNPRIYYNTLANNKRQTYKVKIEYFIPCGSQVQIYPTIGTDAAAAGITPGSWQCSDNNDDVADYPCSTNLTCTSVSNTPQNQTLAFTMSGNTRATYQWHQNFQLISVGLLDRTSPTNGYHTYYTVHGGVPDIAISGMTLTRSNQTYINCRNYANPIPNYNYSTTSLLLTFSLPLSSSSVNNNIYCSDDQAIGRLDQETTTFYYAQIGYNSSLKSSTTSSGLDQVEFYIFNSSNLEPSKYAKLNINVNDGPNGVKSSSNSQLSVPFVQSFWTDYPDLVFERASFTPSVFSTTSSIFESFKVMDFYQYFAFNFPVLSTTPLYPYQIDKNDPHTFKSPDPSYINPYYTDPVNGIQHNLGPYNLIVPKFQPNQVLQFSYVSSYKYSGSASTQITNIFSQTLSGLLGLTVLKDVADIVKPIVEQYYDSGHWYTTNDKGAGSGIINTRFSNNLWGLNYIYQKKEINVQSDLGNFKLIMYLE